MTGLMVLDQAGVFITKIRKVITLKKNDDHVFGTGRDTILLQVAELCERPCTAYTQIQYSEVQHSTQNGCEQLVVLQKAQFSERVARNCDFPVRKNLLRF